MNQLLLNTQIFDCKLVRVDMNIMKSPLFRIPLYYVVVRYLQDVDTLTKEWFLTLCHGIPIIFLKLYPYGLYCHSATAILYFYNIKVVIAEK